MTLRPSPLRIFPLLLALLLASLTAIPARAATEVQEVVSPGGITAWLVEEPAIPMLAIELNFRVGTALDLPGREGAITLMTGLLDEGAGALDAAAFARRADDLAARFRFDAGRDSVNVSARMLTETRSQSLELLRSALAQPRFDPEATERVRAQVQTVLERERTDPSAIAQAALRELAFGIHPYAAPLRGTPQSVAALTRDDLLAAHRRAFSRQQVLITVVGDITADQLGPLLDVLLGDLPETAAETPPPAPMLLTGGQTRIAFPGPQALVLFGQPGISRDDPDFLAAFVGNHILGGRVVTSRLNQALRGERGLTYGVGTALAPGTLGDLILGQFSTANETADQAVEILRAEWATLAENGVTQAELDAAITYLTGSFALLFDGNAAIAQVLTGFQIAGLGRDYPALRNDLVAALSIEQVNAVLRRAFDPDALHVVIVGGAGE